MVCDPPASQRPFINALSWIQAGRRCGIDVLQVFEALGIQRHSGPMQSLRLPPGVILSALQHCTHRSLTDHFPLVLGRVLADEHAPAAEAYLATSPTPREALRLLELAARCVNPWLTIRLEETADEAWISCDLPPDPHMAQPLHLMTESALCAILHIGLSLLGPDAGLRAVHFRHDAARPAELYHRHFGIAPRFGQWRNAIFFDRAFLDRRLPGGSVDLHREALQWLAAQQVEPQPDTAFSTQVERHLRRNLHLLQGGLPPLARHMELTPRSLQRRLAREGRVFSELLDQVRRDLATRWLTDPARDIHSVSERLGYRDRRAFTSAFKRWTGLSPSQYRQQAHPPGRIDP